MNKEKYQPTPEGVAKAEEIKEFRPLPGEEIKDYHRWLSPEIDTFRNIRPDFTRAIESSKVAKELEKNGKNVEDLNRRYSQEIDSLGVGVFMEGISPPYDPEDYNKSKKKFGDFFSQLSDEEQRRRVLREAELRFSTGKELFSERLSRLLASKREELVQAFIATKKAGNKLDLLVDKRAHQILEEAEKEERGKIVDSSH